MMAALRVGLSISEYNEITPHELNMHIKAYNERQKRDDNNGLALAYLNAGWTRAKRLPPWNKVIEQEKPKAQTPEQMLKMVQMLNAKFGGLVVNKQDESGS